MKNAKDEDKWSAATFATRKNTTTVFLTKSGYIFFCPFRNIKQHKPVPLYENTDIYVNYEVFN